MNTTESGVPKVELAWKTLDRNHRVVAKRKIVAVSAAQRTMKKLRKGGAYDFWTRDAE